MEGCRALGRSKGADGRLPSGILLRGELELLGRTIVVADSLTYLQASSQTPDNDPTPVNSLRFVTAVEVFDSGQVTNV